MFIETSNNFWDFDDNMEKVINKKKIKFNFH